MNTPFKSFEGKPDLVEVVRLEEHDYWKPILLDYIKSMVEENNIKLNEKGYLYDYDLDTKIARKYQWPFYQAIFPYVEDLFQSYGLRLDVEEYKREGAPLPWFQQYFQSSDFGWHHHAGHFACIYYLELPESKEATEFLNFKNYVEEGDLIFFPTFLIHRSPVIRSNKRKTILSLNLKGKVDRKLINNYRS